MSNNYGYSGVQPTDDDMFPSKRPSNKVYFTIYEGMLCRKRSTPETGFVEYISQSDKTRGKVSYIYQHEYLDGWLIAIDKRDKETRDGKKFVVFDFVFANGSGREAVVQVPARGEFVSVFAKCVENMDLSKRIRVRVGREKGTVNSYVYFEQVQKNENGVLDHVVIKRKYTKENPNGLPQWVKDEISGDWDSREYWKFLYQKLLAVRPQIEQNKHRMTQMMLEREGAIDHGEPEIEPEFSGPPPTGGEVNTYDDDIPF